jgi:hypothetical protein
MGVLAAFAPSAAPFEAMLDLVQYVGSAGGCVAAPAHAHLPVQV